MSFIATVIKKSTEIPENIDALSTSVKLLADALLKLREHVVSVTTLVKKHNDAISDIIHVQQYILSNMQSTKNVSYSSDLKNDKLN
jgi:DNA repair ATPase RecN